METIFKEHFWFCWCSTTIAECNAPYCALGQSRRALGRPGRSPRSDWRTGCEGTTEPKGKKWKEQSYHCKLKKAEAASSSGPQTDTLDCRQHEDTKWRSRNFYKSTDSQFEELQCRNFWHIEILKHDADKTRSLFSTRADMKLFFNSL